MSSNAIVINFRKKSAFIGVYRVTIQMTAKKRDQFLTKSLLTYEENVILPCSEAIVSFVRIPLSNNRGFIFYHIFQANLTFYSHIVDYEILKILIKNASNLSLFIPRWHKLGHLLNIVYDNYFLIDIWSTYDSTAVPPSVSFFSTLALGLYYHLLIIQ